MLGTFGFIDLAGYTALTDVHGDAQAADTASTFYRLLESEPGRVRIVKRLGDAVMFVAEDGAEAVRFAEQAYRLTAAEPSLPLLRAGLYTGTAVERGGDFFGAAVNVAARLCAVAGAGELVCGRDLAPCFAGRAEPLGALALKNVAEPVEAWRVRFDSSDPVDPVCRMRVQRLDTFAADARGHRTYFCSARCRQRFLASLGGGR